ncbi:MAG TPA: hypothetical protein PK129_03510, partial [Cellvibrionaceae bacterium]|nr:hypothetical protein [Cellvibrionaceae bacterium]
AEHLFRQGQDMAEGWNFRPRDEDARPVQWIVERLCKLWKSDAQWSIQPGQHPHEANFLKLDISKARQRLHWSPRWTLDETLVQIVDWFRHWIDQQDMRVYSLNQIDEYQRIKSYS